ncbi:hypothetical protein GCM10010104_27160 [Streptomyces indiaensis]|uniref:Uncharacterized protein n=1 Tax=Streptomyces indiaensis TaxID=284033 RepID=A0ABN3DI32_9ACTN
MRIPVQQVVCVLPAHRRGGAAEQPHGRRIDREDPSGGIHHDQGRAQWPDDRLPDSPFGPWSASLVSRTLHLATASVRESLV